MTSVTETTLSSMLTVQQTFMALASLALTDYKFAPNTTLTNGTSYDYIVCGAGTAGSTVASKLSENGTYSVLVIEEGGVPPLESMMAGMFPVLTNTSYDYNTPSVDDNYSAQALQEYLVRVTQGKMLGGGSSLNHMIHVQGSAYDYNQWAKIVNDDRWNYTNVLSYIKQMEKLVDPGLLNTSYVDYHGTDGMIPITREETSEGTAMLAAFKELGHSIIDDISSKVVGYCQPLFNIYEYTRQSNGLCYLGEKVVGSRTNLKVAMSTKVTKILIEDSSATGVEVLTAGGEKYVLYANNEVILSAGAIHSPQLLMLSGIGPKEHLESFNITVVADLPVGKNLTDHPSNALFIQMGATTETVRPTNPYEFPTPTTTGYVALNSSQSYPDYQTINLQFPHDSSALLQLCANVFKYNKTICDNFYAASEGHNTLFVVLNLMKPKSRGKVLLASADYSDDPLVTLGLFSDEDDITLMVESMENFLNVLNTTYFEGLNASFVDPGVCSGKTGTEYNECYVLAMSSTMWHYSGTCKMGMVTDSSLRVKGVSNLRVIDASVMPEIVSGNINAAVTVIAERGAAMILGN